MRVEPIGVVESCFKEKFGIPRQAGLAASATATIHLPLARFRDAVEGLDEFSHLWVIFAFHANKGWKPRVRPPRLGGSRKIGVFASRSPHRPNPIGLSAVKLERIERSKTEILIHVSGADLLDGTPVLDIKPYISYADSIPRARSGWVKEEKQHRLSVSFSPTVTSQLRSTDPTGRRKLRPLIRELISQDPRPAFQREKSGPEAYAFRLCEFDVHWAVSARNAKVLELREMRVDSN